MKTKSLFIILGNQLFPLNELSKHKDCQFLMAEDYNLCTYEKHHKHKLILFLSSMRKYALSIKKQKYSLKYYKLNKKNSYLSYEDKIKDCIKSKKISEIKMFEIEDKFFEKRIIDFGKQNKLTIHFIKSPMFFSSREDFKSYLTKSKKPFMATFYKQQRIEKNILVDDNKPIGGKWSFDEENRKKIPEILITPSQPKFKDDIILQDVKKLVNELFPEHPGDTNNFWLGTSRDEALKALDFFIKEKIENFGHYEDAVKKHSPFLFHSVLSSYINLGLITPKEVITKILSLNKKKNIPINSLEGFIRQVIGWREFMRGIYQNYDERLKNTNFFNHKNKMKISWYNGTTGLDPLDHSIKNALNYGWSHHIERLMILANIMNLCQIHPNQVYKWFMEMFVDSSDWVMAPNVYGMGLFSDGGIFATKPYICGSSYFLKMMDFKKGEWCNIMDGLYWNFINKNRKFFLKNPRLSMMVRVFDKIKNERKKIILKAAEKFIKQNTI